MRLTREILRKIFSGARPAILDAVVAAAPAIEAAKIDTRDRLTGYLASIGVESGGLRAVEESLNYTSAQRIYDTFKGTRENPRFRSPAECQRYVRKPKELAIKVYGGRMGNAPGPSADGWIYRGGGLMQTTGRDGYKALGFEDKPEALRDPAVAVATSIKEWVRRRCNAKADKRDWKGVRQAINGGLNGYAHFLEYIVKVGNVLPGAAVSGGAHPARAGFLNTSPEPDASPDSFDPLAVPITDENTVRFVQAGLNGLGYTEVGSRTADGDFTGKMGPFTEAAILAARTDNGLPLRPTIDAQFIDAMPSFRRREISSSRTDASTKDVVARVPEALSAWRARLWAAIGTAGAFVVGIAKDLVGAISPATETVRPLRDLLVDIPSSVWIGLTFAVAATSAVGIYFANRATKQSKEAFKDGSRR